MLIFVCACRGEHWIFKYEKIVFLKFTDLYLGMLQGELEGGGENLAVSQFSHVTENFQMYMHAKILC